MTLKIFF